MRRIAMVVALGAAACGNASGSGGVGATAGNPSVGTTLIAKGSLPLSAADATAVLGGASCQVNGASAGVAYAVLLASDQPGICGHLEANQDRANARSIELIVVRADPSNAATSVTAGTYPVVASPSGETIHAFVAVTQNDAACSPSVLAAASGSVSVTSVAGGRFQGTVIANLSDGGTVTGSFDTDECAVTLPGDACTGDIGLVNPTCVP